MSLRVASFVSGGGTTMQQAFLAAQAGDIPGIEPALVIAQKPGIGAIEKAKKLGIPDEVLSNPKDPAEILQLLYRYKIDVIFQNGYLPLMPDEIVHMYSAEGSPGRIFNQHPGIVRADHRDFGGRGMYGARVTAARILFLLATGATGEEVFTESTVQYTHEELDKGVLLGAKRLDFAKDFEIFRDSNHLTKNIARKVDTLHVQRLLREFTGKIQGLLLPLEHKNVIELLQRVGRREELQEESIYRNPLVSVRDLPVLQWAKMEAGVLFPKG